MRATGTTQRLGGEPRVNGYAQTGREGTPTLMDEWGSIALSAESIEAAPGLRSSPSAVLIMGITPTERAIAIAIVPHTLSGEMRRNGVPVHAGLQLLRHGDLLELGRKRLWLSGERAVTEESYDPAQHGEGTRCARSKSLFVAGDLITRCPGTPERPECGQLYRSDVWAGMRCHGCGYDPNRPAWKPPQPTEHGSLDAYLDEIQHG